MTINPENKNIIMSPWRADFPCLQQNMHDKPLAYLDSASSTQKPNSVLNALQDFYKKDYANVHRGLYELSERASNAFENVRDKTQFFIGAKSRKEIIFTKGTTESINLIAHSYAMSTLKQGDEIILSQMEHHANIVPWQQVAKQTGAVIRVVPLSENGALNLNAYAEMLSAKTKIVSIVYASNVLGVVNPVKKMTQMAHAVDAVFVCDAAQMVAHAPIDVQDLNCDFLVFSAHKAFGPTGVGVCYAREAILSDMIPYQTGGDMIRTVSFEKTEFNEIPYRFEAGTPNIAGVVAWGAAIDYLTQLDPEKIHVHENKIINYFNECMADFSEYQPAVNYLDPELETVAVRSFTWKGVHPHDLATILDKSGVACRAGHHCAMPLMRALKVPALLRVSFACYSDHTDINALLSGLEQVQKIFSGGMNV